MNYVLKNIKRTYVITFQKNAYKKLHTKNIAKMWLVKFVMFSLLYVEWFLQSAEIFSHGLSIDANVDFS
jgi:hypothetical protein